MGLTFGAWLNNVLRTISSAPSRKVVTLFPGSPASQFATRCKNTSTDAFTCARTGGATSFGAGTDSWAKAEAQTGNCTAFAPGADPATEADGATRATEPRSAALPDPAATGATATGATATDGADTGAADGNADPESPALDSS